MEACERLEFTEAYNTYIHHYGDPRWAISEESAMWLASFCQSNHLERIYDFGSGFTSWVLRRFSKARVTTVETSGQWFLTTKLFLEKFPTDNAGRTVFLDDIKQEEVEPGELVVYDIKGDIRKQELPFALSCTKPDGVFFADDAQRGEYMAFTMSAANEAGLVTCQELASLTDEYGRFPAVFHKGEWSFEDI